MKKIWKGVLMRTGLRLGYSSKPNEEKQLSQKLVRGVQISLDHHTAKDYSMEELIELTMQYPFVISYMRPTVHQDLSNSQVHIHVQMIGDHADDLKSFLSCKLLQSGVNTRISYEA